VLKRFFRALGGESSQSVPKYTLEKYHRLRDRARFEEILDHGERLHGTAFILLYLPNTLSFARLGIIVSKRKCKLSVDRNYVRRIVREQFRLNQQLLSGHDLIVLLKKNLNHKDKTLQSQFQKQLAQLAAHIKPA